MPREIEEHIEGAIMLAMVTGRLGGMVDDLASAGRDYPDDSRGAHYGALAAFFEDGKELDARRELMRALSLRPRATSGILWRTVYLLRSTGFDVAAAGLFARAEAQKDQVSPILADVSSVLFLTIEPPYRDPERAEPLCVAAQEGGAPNPLLPLIRAHAVFGRGKTAEAAEKFDGLAMAAAELGDEAMTELVRDRARRCREGTARPDCMARFPVWGVVISEFFRRLNREEVDWRASWDPRAAEQPASVLDQIADDEDSSVRPERAAVTFFHAARAWAAAGDGERRLASLRRGFQVAEHAGLDVRALLARTYARALVESDPTRAEEVAKGSIAPAAPGTTEYRTQDELADGYLIIAEAQLKLGKKKEAAASLKKGLDLAPYDRRPFEALKARLE